MGDWHPCLPGHVFDSGGLCGRCGLLDRDRATDPKAEYSILRKSDHAALIEAANKQRLAGKWRYVRMNQPAPDGDDFVVIAAAEYEAWRLRFKKDRDDQDAALRNALRDLIIQREYSAGQERKIEELQAELDQAAGVIADRSAELEEATLARGRLRLWLEFIHHNSTSPEAREYAGEALNGAHVPEGYDWDERSGRHDYLP